MQQKRQPGGALRLEPLSFPTWFFRIVSLKDACVINVLKLR